MTLAQRKLPKDNVVMEEQPNRTELPLVGT